MQGMAFDELCALTGDEMREVSVNPPKGSWKFLSNFPIMKGCNEAAHVLKLVKGVYGLKDAPRAWRIKLDIVLQKLGGKPMKSDPCLYIWHTKQGTLYCVMSTHVDDLKITGRPDKVKFLIELLEKEFGKLKKKEKGFEPCGIMHFQDKEGNIQIHMNHYIAQLSSLPLPKNVNLESDCSEADAASYILLLGGVA